MAVAKPAYTPGDLQNHHAIAAVIQNEVGEYLMFFHKKFGFWTIPIGKAEPAETPYQGLCTELQEECAITVQAATEIATNEYSYTRNGRAVEAILHLYKVDAFTGIPQNNEPHKHPKMQYMTLQQIKDLEETSDSTQLLLDTIG